MQSEWSGNLANKIITLSLPVRPFVLTVCSKSKTFRSSGLSSINDFWWAKRVSMKTICFQSLKKFVNDVV